MHALGARVDERLMCNLRIRIIIFSSLEFVQNRQYMLMSAPSSSFPFIVQSNTCTRHVPCPIASAPDARYSCLPRTRHICVGGDTPTRPRKCKKHRLGGRNFKMALREHRPHAASFGNSPQELFRNARPHAFALLSLQN